MIRCVAGLEWPYACGEVKSFEMYEDDGTPTRDTLEPRGRAASLQQQAWASRRRVAFSPEVVVRSYVVQPWDVFEQREREEAAVRDACKREMYGSDSDCESEGDDDV